MLTFYHSPNSRSSAIMALILAMGIEDKLDIVTVTIPRMDGSGGPDPRNPHPEKKVPCLVHDGRVITERGAVIAHLATLFPSDMAPAVGSPDWGVFLTWMAWYQGVMEPVLILDAAGVSHPYMTAAVRGVDEVTARVRSALQQGPWLMGDHYTAADLLIYSPYGWFGNAPDDPLIQDWAARCAARPFHARLKAMEAASVQAMAA